MTRRLIVVAALAVVPVLAAAPSPALPSAIGGVAAVTPPGCDEGALRMPLDMASDSGNVWIATRPASIAAHCEAIVYGLTLTFAGRWDADEGGCVDSISHPGTSMCIGPVPRLAKTTTSFALCFPTEPRQCWEGAATVVRA